MLVVYPKGGNAGAAGGAIISYSHNASLSPGVNASGDLTSSFLLTTSNDSPAIIVSGGKFTLTDAQLYTFPMPFDGRITAVTGRYSTIALWRPVVDITPYVAVAIAPVESHEYTVNATSKALADPFKADAVPSYPNRTVRIGSAKAPDIPVKKGEAIAIVVGIEETDEKQVYTVPFMFSCSIVIDKA